MVWMLPVLLYWFKQDEIRRNENESAGRYYDRYMSDWERDLPGKYTKEKKERGGPVYGILSVLFGLTILGLIYLLKWL